jgi:glutamate 5-kinase
MNDKSVHFRQQAISRTSRVVIKVGTRLLTDTSKIPLLMEQIYKLRVKGYEVILVSSGAVGIGMSMIQLPKRPQQLSKIQALASIGQGKLISLYEDAAKKNGFHAGQLLLTLTGVQKREQHLNMLNCINTLLDMNILPIINENDSVSVDELTFGDNDLLAAFVGAMTRCQTTIILTTVDGLHNTNSGVLKNRISVVEKLTPKIQSLAKDTDDTNASIGGMRSKLKAANITTSAGEYLWIADGRDISVLEKIFNAEDVGTLFLPSKNKQMSSKKRWLSFFTRIRGQLFVDNGAANAVLKNGCSLLPSGIKSIKGEFKRGDAVEIVSSNNKAIAKGLINYSNQEVNKILGINSDKIQSVLGYSGDQEVVHRDNLVIDM